MKTKSKKWYALGALAAVVIVAGALSQGELLQGSFGRDDDHDGMSDLWEKTYGLDYTTNDAASDLDGDTLTNLQEFVLHTYPNDTDTDDDLFRDDYEVAQHKSPTKSSETPGVWVRFVSYADSYGNGYSGLWNSPVINGANTLSKVLLTTSIPGYGEVYTSTMNGGFGVFVDPAQYLGSVLVEDCGKDAAAFNPISRTCTTISDFSSSSDTEITHVTDSSQLEVWSNFSPYWSYDVFDWYRVPARSATQYSAFKMTLGS